MIALDAALINQVGNFLRDNTGLTASGAGQNQQWTIYVLGGFPLARIELIHGVRLPIKFEAGESRHCSSPLWLLSHRLNLRQLFARINSWAHSEHYLLE